MVGLAGLNVTSFQHLVVRMRIALGIEYEGSAFCGWQSQTSGCAIQDHLKLALSAMAGHEICTHAAGRTDTGVHALSQVIHFTTSVNRPVSAWVRGVNSQLPVAIRVLWAKEVDEQFHARFSASARHYQYLLVNRAVAPAVLAGRAGWFHQPLTLAVMKQAAHYLVGTHDFSAFRAAECQAKSPIKQLHRAEVNQSGDMFIFEFSANAFLHHQVRNMLGALIYIGKGKYRPEWILELLEAKDRARAAPTFDASGLYLCGVDYPEEYGLPETSRGLQEFVLPF